VTYQWNFTQGSSASGSTTGTTGTAQNVGAGDYSFQVRACNAGGLCSAYAASASRHIDTPPPPPPPPPPVVTISKGTQATSTYCPSTSCYWIVVSATGFAPNTAYSFSFQTDHGTNPRVIGEYTTATFSADSSGSFNLNTRLFGYPGYNVQVVINNVPSNIVAW